jgi:hypothetical protein
MSSRLADERAYEQQIRDAYLNGTQNHQIDVIRDDGVYRHIRFKHPEYPFNWFELVTWPWRLVVTGDCGDFMFSRTEDMFTFFESARGDINVHYWAEKLLAPGGFEDAAYEYDFELFQQHVNSWYEGAASALSAKEAQGLREEVDLILLGEDSYARHSEDEAYRLLHEFDFNGIRFYDTHDWFLRRPRRSFVWCLWAVVDGISRYREHVAAKRSAAPS